MIITKPTERRPAEGSDPVTPLRFILHLRQVINFHMQEESLMIFEGILRGLQFFGLDGIEVAHAQAAQSPIKL